MLWAASTLLPWLLGLAGMTALGIFGWRIGMPLIRIAELKAHVSLLEVKLATAQESMKAAEAREQRCVERLEEATLKLETAEREVRTLMGALQIKTKLDTLADQLQPHP